MTASQARLAATGTRVSAIARSTATVSLDLLRAIDGTVDAMNGVAKVTTGLVVFLTSVTHEVSSAEVFESEYLDADDQAIDTMERSAGELKDHLAQLVRRRATIDCDPKLHDHHCEALRDAYQAAIDGVAELIETLEKARSAVITHDLKAEPRGGPEVFATVSDLITNLRGE